LCVCCSRVCNASAWLGLDSAAASAICPIIFYCLRLCFEFRSILNSLTLANVHSQCKSRHRLLLAMIMRASSRESFLRTSVGSNSQALFGNRLLHNGKQENLSKLEQHCNNTRASQNSSSSVIPVVYTVSARLSRKSRIKEMKKCCLDGRAASSRKEVQRAVERRAPPSEPETLRSTEIAAKSVA